jgi:lipid-A-disaccharide synthase
MVLPLDEAEEYPLDGLPGLLPLWIPGVKKLKRNYIMRLNERTDFVSLPNKMAKKMIAPEIRGIFREDDVARKAISLLGSPEELDRIGRAFWELTHERGASARLASRIAEWTKK